LPFLAFLPPFSKKALTKCTYYGTFVYVMPKPNPILSVVFYRTETDREPVREWIKGLAVADRKEIGQDVKTAQFGWPLGMPLIRKIEKDLWEVRSRIKDGIARVFFTVEGTTMVLLHGFVKNPRPLHKTILL
jgi:phage-related protein